MIFRTRLRVSWGHGLGASVLYIVAGRASLHRRGIRFIRSNNLHTQLSYATTIEPFAAIETASNFCSAITLLSRTFPIALSRAFQLLLQSSTVVPLSLNLMLGAGPPSVRCGWCCRAPTNSGCPHSSTTRSPGSHLRDREAKINESSFLIYQFCTATPQSHIVHGGDPAKMWSILEDHTAE